MRLDIKFIIKLIVTLSIKSNALILRLPCGEIYADFVIAKLDQILQGSVVGTIKGVSDIQCTAECAEHPLCRSYNIHRENKICELNSKKEGDFNVTLVQSVGWLYKSTDYNETLVGRTCKALDPCPKNVLCKDICHAPYYQCVHCNKDYTGLHCDKATNNDHCAETPCKNGGICQSSEPNGYSCKCLNGYSGKNCEFDIDECDSLPCFNGGACINEINNFRCSCASGFTGRNCEADINECISTPCMNGGGCVNQINSFKCSCLPGFEGNVCENNIDECKSTPCQNNGTCVDEANQYTCSCLPGYTGKNCETDIDECESSPCQNGGNCSQSVNSYTCSCMPGYNGTNCELDIDECLARPCLNGGACNNLINSYSCTCLYGFSGNTCEIEINPCLSYPCKNGGTCNNLVTHFSCTCQGQYGGLLCHPYCNRVLNTLSGEIVSNNYPSNYPSYTNCYWLIQVASGYRIKVVFHDFLLEQRYGGDCGADYVQLFNGKMSSAPRIGDILCNSDSPGTKISSGNVMLIEFKTDGSTNYRGFNLTWSTLT